MGGGEVDRGIEIFNKLPKYLWDLMIFNRLGLKDLIRFGAVCHSWTSIAAEVQGDLHRLPWLMISRDPKTKIGTFLSLAENKIYNLLVSELGPGRFCCGSSQGFLIVATLENNFLFNPFSQIRVDLPHQYIPPKLARVCFVHNFYYFKKAILYETDDSHYVVSALSSDLGIIEMCRPHDTEWVIFGAEKEEIIPKFTESIDFLSDEEQEEEEVAVVVSEDEEEPVEDNNWLFSDILFYNGMLYGLTRANGLVSFELQQDLRVHTVLNVQPMSCLTDTGFNVISNYLVESCGELLMVYRFGNYSIEEHKSLTVTKKFLVFRLDQSSDLLQWVQLQCLGDQVLFLGKNSSMSISTTGIQGFKGNCIYFTDDLWPYFSYGDNPQYNNSDNGVFYLENGHIESLSIPENSYSTKQPPVWVMPNSLLAHISNVKEVV